jgi:hypothetical protein
MLLFASHVDVMEPDTTEENKKAWSFEPGVFISTA